LHGADHDGPRVGGKLFEGVLGMGGAIDMADRLGMAVRSEPGDLVECEFRPGGHHQVIVVDRNAVRELNTVLRGMHALRALR